MLWNWNGELLTLQSKLQRIVKQAEQQRFDFAKRTRETALEHFQAWENWRQTYLNFAKHRRDELADLAFDQRESLTSALERLADALRSIHKLKSEQALNDKKPELPKLSQVLETAYDTFDPSDDREFDDEAAGNVKTLLQFLSNAVTDGSGRVMESFLRHFANGEQLPSLQNTYECDYLTALLLDSMPEPLDATQLWRRRRHFIASEADRKLLSAPEFREAVAALMGNVADASGEERKLEAELRMETTRKKGCVVCGRPLHDSAQDDCDYDYADCYDCRSTTGKLFDLNVLILSEDAPEQIPEWRKIRAFLRDTFGDHRTDKELWERMTDRLLVNGWDEERWLRTSYGEYLELLKSGLLNERSIKTEDDHVMPNLGTNPLADLAMNRARNREAAAEKEWRDRSTLDRLESAWDCIYVSECCEVGPAGQIGVDDFYAAWCKWAEGAGIPPGTKQVLGKDLSALLPHIKVRNLRMGAHRHRTYEGIKLIVRDELT